MTRDRSRPARSLLRTTATAIATTALMVGLSACATGSSPASVVDSLTVTGAKDMTQDRERELARMVPSPPAESIEQNPTGVLLSCRGERAYQWTGQTKVVLTADASFDGDALTRRIAAAYDGRDGFRAEIDTTNDGEPRVHVTGSHSEGYLVARSVDGTFVQILSFSPCFLLPEGRSPSAEY